MPVYRMPNGTIVASQVATVAEAAEAAASELVSVCRSGGSSFINVPLLYPDSSFVTVKLDQSGAGVRVSDNGFAYRELEAIGATRSFGRVASSVAELLGVQVDRRAVYVDVSKEQLVRAICDVALASWQIADRVFSKAAEEDEAEIEDYLRDRLTSVFGAALRLPDQKIKGPSTTEWDVSAIVDRGDKRTVFHAVANHPGSIFKVSAAFHDLALLEPPPNLVSVVRSKAALGSKFNILAQAGKVIEEEQADDVYLQAAA
jgi:hypothetical protein